MMHSMNQEPPNPLHLSFCNRQGYPRLDQQNVLQYFANPENRFYDHTCNNEHLRMRGLPPALHARELEKMKGIEYILLQAQEPVLFVIRKQMRHSPTTVVPLTNYYVIAGVIYQAPDLKSIIESKLLAAIHSLESAFDECFNYARFHPSVGYTWSFERDGPTGTATTAKGDSGADPAKKLAQRKEIITDASDRLRANYRHSVDTLIHDLQMKFAPVGPAITGGGSGGSGTEDPNKPPATSATIKTETNEDDGYQNATKNRNQPPPPPPQGGLKKPKLK